MPDKKPMVVYAATYGSVSAAETDLGAVEALHRRGGFQVETPREDRQPGKQLTLPVGEEFMAPVQRHPDRLVARI